MREITPFLWFDNQAEEAVDFYASVFDDVKVTEIARYGEAGPGRSSPTAARRASAAGSRTASASPGRSSPATSPS
jgi:predicted 3-demethylubiquinone-9 3-methyltransferase (glyoxalase superfamily)